MDQQEKEEIVASTSLAPILPRLDHVDRLLQLIEEKHCLVKENREVQLQLIEEKHCLVKENGEDEDNGNGGARNKSIKSLSSAIEEVHNKGTLIDRLSMLEIRVLQLWVEVDEGNTSRSSSSTTTMPPYNNTSLESSRVPTMAKVGGKTRSKEWRRVRRWFRNVALGF